MNEEIKRLEEEISKRTNVILGLIHLQNELMFELNKEVNDIKQAKKTS